MRAASVLYFEKGVALLTALSYVQSGNQVQARLQLCTAHVRSNSTPRSPPAQSQPGTQHWCQSQHNIGHFPAARHVLWTHNRLPPPPLESSCCIRVLPAHSSQGLRDTGLTVRHTLDSVSQAHECVQGRVNVCSDRHAALVAAMATQQVVGALVGCMKFVPLGRVTRR